MWVLVESVLQVVAATSFGWMVALTRLLERDGYRWFKGAPLAVGGAAAGFGGAMLFLSTEGVHHFWLAALASWVLLGRVRHKGELLMAAMLALYLGAWVVQLDNLDTRALLGVFGGLLGIGVAQRLIKRARPALPDSLIDERWAWYAVVAGYLFTVDLDIGFACAVWAFQSGRSSFDDESSRGKLRSWGIKPPLGGGGSS